ncbi:Heterokaryon incompatibility [Macrophomina phaseolina MS6]|uniref:Heterokaryon incompatibility n=1 Tax=Macrophomina phaseolina (strain MS6) TaxID=1126212 RepID=K2RJD2_MACPH|nr:Heterokaryon incompatibility [Macrophomina phaseolina MS6]
MKLDKYQGFGVAAKHASAAAPYIPRRLTSADRTDGEALITLRQWLKECDRDHSACSLGVAGRRINPEPSLPTRLVDVGGEETTDSVRVVHTQGLHGQYLALSHCWAGASFCTNSANLEQYQAAGFRSDDLPQTLRSAVVLTRALGFQYIWIDSLCIIQDSADDWNRESQQMGSVYENAYCTIAATKAPDDNTDFLKTARPKVEIAVPCDPDDLQQGYFYFTNPYLFDFKQEVETARLNHRGWVVQERLLSRRTIHLAEKQMFWECREAILGEDGCHYQASVEEGLAGLGRFVSGFERGKERLRGNVCWDANIIEQSFINNWHRIVSTYSGCGFTHDSDRLPALLGLADRLAPTTDLVYYRGNWINAESKHPPRCLAWWACSPGKRTGDSQVRAPTWSWSALEGEVVFERTDRRPLVEMLGLDMSPREGIPNYAVLKLRGRLRAASLHPPPQDGAGRRERERVASFYLAGDGGMDADTSGGIGHVTFDSEEDMAKSFACLLLYVDQVDCAIVLALEQTDGVSQGVPEFRRVGIGSLKRELGESLFGEETEFVLV